MILKRCLRLSCALSAAIVYFMTSSNLGAFTIDTIIPQYKTVAPKSFSCAGHGCSCDLARQANKSCCCFPKRPQPKVCLLSTDISGQHEKETVRITFLSVAKCNGQVTDEGILLKSLEPHLASACAKTLDKFRPQMLYAISKNIKYNVAREPHEKVPL